MGDMADFLNEQIEDEEEARADYWCGRMTHIEAYDRGIIDEFGRFIGPQSGIAVVTKTCRCCGKPGLIWKQASGKWLLHEGSNIHACPINPINQRKKK